jgi:hypothetical protein
MELVKDSRRRRELVRDSKRRLELDNTTWQLGGKSLQALADRPFGKLCKVHT